MIERVLITDAAKKVVDKLREQHGELMFHQSGGCCAAQQQILLFRTTRMLPFHEDMFCLTNMSDKKRRSASNNIFLPDQLLHE